MSIRERIAKLRSHLRRGRQRIARIVKRNERRRRAIARLEAELEATVMFDSVDLDQIPANAPAVGAYTGGRWPTYWEAVKRFPHAFVLAIAIAASEDATCLDIETGDATIAEASGWVRRQHARGLKRPWLYISVANAEQLLAALAAAGIARHEFVLFTAHWTYELHLCGPHSCGALKSTTAEASQCNDHALGRNLDESLVAAGVIG